MSCCLLFNHWYPSFYVGRPESLFLGRPLYIKKKEQPIFGYSFSFVVSVCNFFSNASIDVLIVNAWAFELN